MAVTTTIKSRVLAIEVQTDTDKAGDPIFSKKTFSGVKTNADLAACYKVGESIKAVLAANTRETFLNEVEILANA